MKELTITYPHMARRVSIGDDAKGIAAYDALKAAMAEYKDYGNDKGRTVEVDYGHGTENIVVGAIASVGLSDLDVGEETMIQRAIWEKRFEAKVAAALQPAAE